nr:hypothetical protein [uncultured Flavobacterium sp.]
MCKDCFESEYYKFNSSAEFDKFNDEFDSKISKTILFVETEKYRADLHNVYKCKSCEETWWRSDPDNHWHGYFLKEKNAKKFIDEDERKGKSIKFGCLIILVFLIIYFLF